MRTVFQTHVHRKADLVELRWTDWCMGGFLVAVSLPHGDPLHSMTTRFRWQPLRAALDTCGYALTRETRGLRAERQSGGVDKDEARYGLLECP